MAILIFVRDGISSFGQLSECPEGVQAIIEEAHFSFRIYAPLNWAAPYLAFYSQPLIIRTPDIRIFGIRTGFAKTGIIPS